LSDLSARRVEDRVLAMLTVAADAGRPCPTNAALAQTLGLTDANTASVLVKRLETRGAIRVARQGYARQVVIAATGATTAPIRAAVKSLAAPGIRGMTEMSEPGKAPTAHPRKQA
jgi:SOS-response transcriptional repressor LexA